MFTANNDFGVTYAKERRAVEIEEAQARYGSGAVRGPGRISRLTKGAAALADAATAALSLIADLAAGTRSAQSRRPRRRPNDASSPTQLAP